MALFDFFWRLLATPEGTSADSPPSAPVQQEETLLTVLVTAVDGDDAGDITRDLTAALKAVPGLDVRSIGASVGSVDETEHAPNELSKLVKRARTLARQAEVDVVVAAEKLSAEAVRVRLVAVASEGDAVTGAWTAGDLIDLALPVAAEGAGCLAACIGAASQSMRDSARRRRLELLRVGLPRLEGGLQSGGTVISSDARASAGVCCAAVLGELGIRTSQRPMIERAQEILRASVTKGKESMPPMQVAAARAHMGEFLADLGARDKDQKVLEEAAGHLDAAASAFSSDYLPDDCAALMAQAGRTWHRLASFSGDTRHMKEAAQAYRAATQVWTKAQHPERWAEMTQGMGAVMLQFGEFSGADQVLDRSAKLFTSVLDFWTREEYPRRWASLMNNIGACRFAQGKRSGDLPVLREASECFAKAMEVYQAVGMTKNVHVIHKNLARVERLIAIQESKQR